MKFLIHITKDVIDRSLMCGTAFHTDNIGENCAFAVAYGELVPCVVGVYRVFFKIPKEGAEIFLTTDQQEFIKLFDSLRVTPEKRYELVGRQFEVEIPDEVINHYYGDSVKAAQKIINNPILQTVNI